MGVAQGTAVVGDERGDAVALRHPPHHLAQLRDPLCGIDPDQREPPLLVEQDAEQVLGLRDLQHVHEPAGVLRVNAHPAVDLHVALPQDELRLPGIQRVLESVAEEHDQGDALTELVGPRTGSGGVDPFEFG